MISLTRLNTRRRKALSGAIIDFSSDSSRLGRLAKCLRERKNEFLVNVGANEGQFDHDLWTGGFEGRILSLEPMTVAQRLLPEAGRRDSAWMARPRCVIGASEGEIKLNISNNSVSSSVLPMLPAHSQAAPQSIYLGKETVPRTTLDLAAVNFLGGAQSPFLKVDAQGYMKV